MNEIERKWLELYKSFAPEKILDEFLPILGKAWDEKKTFFTEKSSEDSITRTICDIVQRKIRADCKRWSCYPQVEIIEEDTTGLGRTKGRCDLIVMLPACREYIFECKLLKSRGSSFHMTASARLYVKQGMLRFLKPSATQKTAEPQYPTWLGFAGMIGYVMNGTVACACDALIVAIKKHAPPISLSSPYPSYRPSQNVEHFHTEHKNCVQQAVIMHHIVLGL